MINKPPLRKKIQEDTDQEDVSTVERGWALFFEEAFIILRSLQQAGTTAQRPTRFLWTGRRYFDSDLGSGGKPIYYNGTVWVDATGASV